MNAPRKINSTVAERKTTDTPTMVKEERQNLNSGDRIFADSASRKNYAEFCIKYSDLPVDAVRCREHVQVSDEYTTTEVEVPMFQQCDHPRPFLWICEIPPYNARAGHCTHTAA